MKRATFILLLLFPISESVIDERDGKEYTKLNLAQQTWLMENMNYTFQSVNNTDSVFYQPQALQNQYGVYYSSNSAKNACPEGYHLPALAEWKQLINEIPGELNSRQGKLIPLTQLASYGFQLGGMGRKDTVLLNGRMGYYWTATDTLKPYFKEHDAGNQRHLIGIHIWSSGEPDSINIEPTYMLAETYESSFLMNCKCVADK